MSAGGSPHRAWIEIDHAALRNNLAEVRRLAGTDKQVIGVVKASAYGHGALQVAETLLAAGTERLAVATLGEGLQLRDAGIAAPLLLLWGLGEAEAAPAVAADLEVTVYSEWDVAFLERAAADAGWVPYQLQIGQTGKVVKPSLYLGCGISGAIQHRVGMQTAENVVAINKDPDAPIGEFADLYVVGDLFQIVPRLTEEIERRRVQ